MRKDMQALTKRKMVNLCQYQTKQTSTQEIFLEIETFHDDKVTLKRIYGNSEFA